MLTRLNNARGPKPCPNPIAVGLPKPGYVWSPFPVSVSILDVEDHIGWADFDLIELVFNVSRIPIHHRLQLRHYQMSLTLILQPGLSTAFRTPRSPLS